MKIINVDNMDREMYSDKLIAENVNRFYGELIVEVLNDKHSGSNSPDWYRLVSDDHELYSFRP